MKAIAFQQITGLSAVKGLGFDISGAAAYNAATGYTVGQRVTYDGFTWVCLTAGTGQTPAYPSAYWIKVNATSGIPVDATHVLAHAELKSVRYREDGRDPAGDLIAPVQSAAVAIAGGSLVDTTTYYWVITAYNEYGETVKSNQQSLVIGATNKTATLSWAQVVGADGYKVFRSTTTNVYTTPALVTTITSGSTLTYNDTGTAVGTGAVLGASTALAVGMLLSATDLGTTGGVFEKWFEATKLSDVKIIETAVSAKLNVTYYQG